MSKSEKSSGPQVLCVFVADCKATKGFGSTVAVVQGSSGKCRMYGKDSLANAYPESADICRTLTTAAKMADNFGVKVIIGKDACDRFVSDNKVKWEGSENVLGDKGMSGNKRGGFKRIDYRTF